MARRRSEALVIRLVTVNFPVSVTRRAVPFSITVPSFFTVMGKAGAFSMYSAPAVMRENTPLTAASAVMVA